MNSAVFVFVALAAFAVDAAVIPLNGAWGNSLFASGLPFGSVFGTGTLNAFPGSGYTLGPLNTIKIVPSTSLVPSTATSTPSAQVVQSTPMNFPSVISPAPGVRCVCTSTDVQSPMNIQKLGPFGFTF